MGGDGRARSAPGREDDEPARRRSAPECVSCGTCCFSELETYVTVTGDDHARLGEHAERLVRFEGTRAFMRMEDGHCAALVLDRRKSRFLCSVYDLRPTPCRELARGSSQCEAEIALKGNRPPVALRRSRSSPPPVR